MCLLVLVHIWFVQMHFTTWFCYSIWKQCWFSKNICS